MATEQTPSTEEDHEMQLKAEGKASKRSLRFFFDFVRKHNVFSFSYLVLQYDNML